MENNTAAAEEVVESAATADAAIAVKPKRHINQQKLQDNLWGWIFCLPLIVGTVLFIYIALIMAVLISFTVYSSTLHGNVFDFLGTMFSGGEINYDGDLLNVFSDQMLVDGEWVTRTDALRWYKYIFTNVESSCADAAQMELEMSTMGMTLFNTVFYMIGIPIGMVLSMFFAVCMSRDIKGANFFRVLYYLPSVASTVAVVFTFNKLFTDSGVINSLLGSRIPWFNTGDGKPLLGAEAGIDPFWQQGLLNKTMVVIMMVWKGLGGTIILYIAGLSGVNASTKEAAQIDGASGWKIFWKVTMPDLYPVIFYNIVTSVIGGMQIYAEPELFFPTSGDNHLGMPNLLTSGYVALIWFWGRNPTTSVGADVIDLTGMSSSTPFESLGAAYGMILAIIIFVLTLFQFWLDKKNAE
ncbi:MAG TPA: sugar ABC transporter permease [Candidatus Gallimonas intestinigallinarum]|uniref:Sugar ABC transporter permease n=1 Tax=Candidatus Gallimonas intestinigallinarum TaxID=2838604 RepID=A0A9D2DXJ5_9FIRM|nr:sugar ABC transporter permease [Candidatus Gallimonas intestinigallinarum]